jgi:hypothetical protein
MSQVQDGSGRKAGAPASKASPTKRPPAKAAPKGRQAGSGSGRPGGGAKGRAPRQNMKITAPPPRRFSPSTLAFVSIAVVVVIVLVFVVVKVTGSSKSPTSATTLAAPVTASPTVVSEVTNVPAAVSDAVGIGQGVTAPQVLKNQPKLTANGKPEMLFIGAEFCPFCAAERWSMVVALSRFGTWSGLTETTSSPWDTDPATATFSFRDAAVTSQYVQFVSVEHETNDNTGPNTRALFQALTPAQAKLWSKYSAQFGQQTGYPFVDVGNKVFVIGPSYDPGGLQGLDQQEIASKLTKASDPVTQAIVGTANYLTAAICSETGNQPASVCTSAGVHKAAVALKLS